MNIAMETSILFPSSGKIDGIGRYAQNIYNGLSVSKDIDLEGFCLPVHLNKEEALQKDQTILSGLPYKYEFLRAMVSSSNYETFFKTDDILFLPDFQRIPIVKNIPMIAAVHDSIPLSHPEWVYSSKISQLKNSFRLKYSASFLDRAICVSEYAAKDVMQHFSIPENKIDIIYHGVDKKFFQPASTEIINSTLDKYSLKSKKYILNVSTLQPRKNQKKIIDAYSKLPKNIKDEYPLVIVGKYGWGCDEVVDKLRYMESNGEARWLNNIVDQELFVLYQESICFVFPSLYEGFGFPILEAMASGTPVITSNIGAMKEIAGEDNAYLLDPYNVDELTFAMKNLVQDSFLKNTLIKRGQDHARKFTWERSIQQHIDVFKKMV